MASETVRIASFSKTGAASVIRLARVPLPQPGKGEVRMRIKAIGLNRVESIYRQGRYLVEPKLPSPIGVEGAGIVEAVGLDVDPSLVGKKMATLPLFDPRAYGVAGEVAILPVHCLAEYPVGLSFEQAASIHMQYTAAYGQIVHYGQVKKGDFVLVTAGSGGVGAAAVEMAKLEGGVSVVTTRNARKKAKLLAMGADHVIVTGSDDLVARVNEITGGKGARVIIDALAGEIVETLAAAAAPGGIILLSGFLATDRYGYADGLATPVPLLHGTMKALTVVFYNVPALLSMPGVLHQAKRYIFDGLAEGKLVPTIDKTFPLDELVQAYEYLESNDHVGKVVVTAPD